MGARQIWLGVYIVPCGTVNTYLVDGGADGLILVDTGWPGKTQRIVDGIRNIGRRPSEIRHIVVTHAHIDHIGGLAELAASTGAEVWASAIDAPIIEAGRGFRPMKAAPELIPSLMFRLLGKDGATVDPAHVDHLFKDGDVLPLAGGLQVIATPGHCAGQVALLWLGHRVMFVADACVNLFGELNSPIGYEDEALGRDSQRKLCAYDYDLACFGHGAPMSGHASVKMARKWLPHPEDDHGHGEHAKASAH